jgi:hypothetical protein
MTKTAASLTVNLPFADLFPAVGAYTFSARLLDQFGAPYVAPDGHAGPCGDGSRCTASLTTQLASCGGPVVPVPDASTPGSPTSDAASPAMDAATSDAGALMDASGLDASALDATTMDAATAPDATILDAAGPDAAGPAPGDASLPIDGAIPDAASPSDASIDASDAG